ncbi:hypothetical protein HYW75_04705 [Candidatus Pacearchaeota archaeon]|nr:hypothetical protein [Candidatus Pacearchaeota archaeon]
MKEKVVNILGKYLFTENNNANNIPQERSRVKENNVNRFTFILLKSGLLVSFICPFIKWLAITTKIASNIIMPINAPQPLSLRKTDAKRPAQDNKPT